MPKYFLRVHDLIPCTPKQKKDYEERERTHFSMAQVKELCGGKFPDADGFSWDEVDFFKLEDGAFEPYDSDFPDEILPGPSLRVRVTEEAMSRLWRRGL